MIFEGLERVVQEKEDEATEDQEECGNYGEPRGYERYVVYSSYDS
jgi:hypothetical protein